MKDNHLLPNSLCWSRSSRRWRIRTKHWWLPYRKTWSIFFNESVSLNLFQLQPRFPRHCRRELLLRLLFSSLLNSQSYLEQFLNRPQSLNLDIFVHLDLRIVALYLLTVSYFPRFYAEFRLLAIKQAFLILFSLFLVSKIL